MQNDEVKIEDYFRYTKKDVSKDAMATEVEVVLLESQMEQLDVWGNKDKKKGGCCSCSKEAKWADEVRLE